MIDYREKYKDSQKLFQSPFDNRDYKFKDALPLAAFEIPDNYETPDAGFTYNQGHSSMCAPTAYSYLRYLQEKDQSDIAEPFCPSFNYANRKDGEDFEGMYIRSLCDKGLEGSVLLSEMKYPNTYIESKMEFLNRKDELLEKASPFRINSYYCCTSRKEIMIAIMQTKGVLIGVPVYTSFYTPDSNGKISYILGQENDGGHCILIDGWKTENDKLYWRIKNSWGPEWGNLGDGHAWLPEEYPWMDNAYAIVDMITEMKFEEYKNKFYNK